MITTSCDKREWRVMVASTLIVLSALTTCLHGMEGENANEG